VNALTLLIQVLGLAEGQSEWGASAGETMTIILANIIGFTLIIGILIAAIVITVKNRRRFREFFTPATPRGKSRALPVFITSIPWVISFVYLLFHVFVLPFIY
jgi:heme/copper-type cytochrome/quinol oxidase subunit 2